MALNMVLPAADGDDILAANYNAEFLNILQNPDDLLNPMTFNLDMNSLSILNTGALRFGTAAPSVTPSGLAPNRSINIEAQGSGSIAFANGATTLGQITSSGQLLWGTTVATNLNAGEMVIPNNKNYRGVNAGGTDTVPLIGADTASRVFISPGGANIRWGGPLVGQGGASAATLGNVGDAGTPSTAAQWAWAKLVLSDGSNFFWIPVWI